MENVNSLKLLLDAQGNGRFATVSHGRIQTLDCILTTGAFHQRSIIVGYTDCSVNGVLGICRFITEDDDLDSSLGVFPRHGDI